MVISMLRFPSPLTAAATEIVISCLEIAADMAIDFDPPEAWRDVYPLSAACFTPALARETLLDLLVKLRLPEAYVPTEYHWLLMYDFLMVAESFARLSAEAKTNLGFSPSVFGVTQGLAPHPEELVLRRAEE